MTMTTTTTSETTPQQQQVEHSDDGHRHLKQHNLREEEDNGAEDNSTDHHHSHNYHDVADHGHDASSSCSSVFYCRPSQRQNWGEAQILPHVDWNATLMDLFYVAAAYNLGNVIRSDPSWNGLLYFVGLFYPIMMVWHTKMYYDSRFCVHGDDIFHKVYEFAVLIALGTAVLYIRPVPILQNPNNIDLFAYTLCTTICHTLATGRIVEVWFNVHGQPAAKTSAKRDLRYYALSLLFYISATIVSGVAYDTTTNKNETMNTTTTTSSSSTLNVSDYDTTDDDQDHRGLADSSSPSSTSSYGSGDYNIVYDTQQQDNTVWLLAAGSFSFQLLIGIMILLLPPGGKHKEISVPMNIDFCIHRYGAWTMLMLGTCVCVCA
jgi:hypothetical protein